MDMEAHANTQETPNLNHQKQKKNDPSLNLPVTESVISGEHELLQQLRDCLLYTSPSPRDI